MRWPYDAHVDSVTAWGVVATGVAVAGIMVTVLAALDGSHPHFRWWWPTGWMLIPAGITAVGVFIATVPLRHTGDADEDASGDRQIITASPGSFLLGKGARLKARDIFVVPSPPAVHDEESVSLGRPLSSVKDPFDLEVHRPLQIEGQLHDDLPPYIPRSHDRTLATVVAEALAGHNQLAMLVGESSTGKTRALWESLDPLREVGGWRLWHPIDPSRPEAALAALGHVGPRTVVWLNEAQFYLEPARIGEQVAAKLRELLRSTDCRPVLVLGSLWPDHWSTLTTYSEPDQHAQARELLAGRHIHVPDSFTDLSEAQLAQASAADARIAAAAARSNDRRIAQYLAGVPTLLDRYRVSRPAARALIHAAMDARRLGHGPHLPLPLLAEAAAGYLTDEEWHEAGEHWLEHALNYATKACKGIPGMLTAIRSRPGEPKPNRPHYRLADYLEQYGAKTRGRICPPASFWHAVMTHVTTVPDLLALGNSARDRNRLQIADGLYRLASGLDPAASNAHFYLWTNLHEYDKADEIACSAKAAGYHGLSIGPILEFMGDSTGDGEAVMPEEEMDSFCSFIVVADEKVPEALSIVMARRPKDVGESGPSIRLVSGGKPGDAEVNVLVQALQDPERFEEAEFLARNAADSGSPCSLHILSAFREFIGDHVGAERLRREAADAGYRNAFGVMLRRYNPKDGVRQYIRRFGLQPDGSVCEPW